MSKNIKRSLPLPVIVLMLVSFSLPACDKEQKQVHHEPHKILVTSPLAKDVTNTQQYVCQIHSYRHIEVRALESGYLEAITVKEGQAVKQGDSLFKVVTTLYQAKLDAELAEAQLAQIEYNNTLKLFQQKVVAQPEVALAQAKLSKAQANVKLSQAELNFANIKAPFDGIIDHQRQQQGSLISEGDILTTLSDNSVMWVYFNVPESRYLEYQANPDKDNLKVELMLANGTKFPQIGKIGAIEADFNNETGNIAFRADFQNPDRVLRHGQTGTILLKRVVKDAIVIPQRATFEILAKKYAFVVEKADLEHVAKDTAMHDGKDAAEHDAKDAAANDGTVAAANDGTDGAEHDAKVVAAHDEKDATEHPVKELGESHGKDSGEHQREHGVVHQREIVILNELDDIFLIKEGLGVNDRIVLEGIRQVRDGEEVEYEFLAPEEALQNLKLHAE